ncbi:MAG TPA: YciI family protein [Pirellulales bacterium]|nr:YciI family protein [Pirellulales bacterium]
MPKFLFVYRNTSESYGNMSPEEMQQMLEKWETWIGEAFKKGWMLDAGDALQKEGRVVNSKKVVCDGPFIEAKEIVGGFSMIQADTLDAAAELAKGCPIFLRSGSVEVRPLRELKMGR